MQNLDEKKADMTEIINCNDVEFSDWENFTDDIDISSLEHSLQEAEFSRETFNDKIIHFPSDWEFYSLRRGDIDQNSPVSGRVENLYDESFEAGSCQHKPSFESNALSLNDSNISIGQKSHSGDFLKEELSIQTAYNHPKKIDLCLSNRNIFAPFSLTSDSENSFSCPDNLQPECMGCYDERDQRLVGQEYPNREGNNLPIQGDSYRHKQNQKCSEILPHASRQEIFDIQENSVSIQGSEMKVSSKIITSSTKNISDGETSCKNIIPCKENYNSERMIFLSENFDSKTMIISSQESSDGQQVIISSQEISDSQRMIISSQETSDSQRMIISSQETSDSQRMIISSQESSGSEKMIISSQEFSDSQKMIFSSQESFGSEKMIISSQEFPYSQKMITSSQDVPDIPKRISLNHESLEDQRMMILSQGSFESQKMIESSQEKFQFQKISSQESFGSQKMIISSQSFDSTNLFISSKVLEDKKMITFKHNIPVKYKVYNTRSGSFLKLLKTINLKTDNKSCQSIGSRLSLKDKKLNKSLDFKTLAGIAHRSTVKTKKHR